MYHLTAQKAKSTESENCQNKICSWGVQQGCHLLPYLFTVGAHKSYFVLKS